MPVTPPPDALVNAVVTVARLLPTRVLVDVANRLEGAPEPAIMVTATTLATVPVDASRDALKSLFSIWSNSHADLPGKALAWSLRSAAATDSWHRAAQSLEIVWTGPAPTGTSLRRTDQALYELVRSAKRELMLVTFAAYKVERLRQALIEACNRGVSLVFVVESPEVGDGKVSFDPMAAFGQDVEAAVWVWPEHKRARGDKGQHGTLHAKCALADERSLLISSANFTGDALGINMELGLLVEGGSAPRVVREHFSRLMGDGVLARVK